MCGIAGLARDVTSSPCPIPVLESLAAALHHRGPDGAHIRRETGADLVHTRLSIIDLAGGDQPLSNHAATLVANGELYNDPLIRQSLGPSAFKTGSDCESALALFTREGAEYPRHLRGMYAIALHDTGTGEVLLSRDPFGIKPLYVAETAHGLAFASEPAALLKAGLVARELCPTAREALLQLRFIPGENTIFPGIRRVLPGETLRVTSGRITSRLRLPALPTTHTSDLLPGLQGTAMENRALALIDAALMDSVSAHERADVPFGLFLSGGIDSACVLTAMSRLKRASPQPATPLRTWTATFDARGAANEAEAASVLARAAGAEHETLMVTRDMVWRHLPEIVACMDDPAADYAIIPTWFLARRLPDNLRVRHGQGKWLLRRWLAQHAPAARPFARKQGFTVPIGTWIAQDGQKLGALVASQDCIAEIAHPERVRALFMAADKTREGACAWGLLFYALWHRPPLQAPPPAGAGVEPLAVCNNARPVID